MAFNGHLLLLVVATGLFVRLWSTNDRPRTPVVVRTPSRSAPTMPPPQPHAPNRGVSVDEVALTSPDDSPREEIWTVATCPIPLPAGIEAGVYRVVDETGRVARLELTAPSPVPAADSQAGPADFQTVTVDSRRWYFIRLQLADSQAKNASEVGAAAVPAVSDSAPIQTACANRKFDFTGYESPLAPSVTEAPASVTEFRPESPDLPETE
jgi:hypothetical protein